LGFGIGRGLVSFGKVMGFGMGYWIGGLEEVKESGFGDAF
jgi:hypothetical protein